MKQDTVITSDSKILKKINDYFSNIALDLGLKVPDALIHHAKKEDSIVNAIIKYQSHPSIKTI